jgi:hypothetical protein
VSELPTIAIEPTAENDIIVVLNALFSTRDAAMLVSRPRAFFETYRAELGLLRDAIAFEAEPARQEPMNAPADAEPVLDGSILR